MSDKQRGLTRAEVIWTAVLLTAFALVIVNTLRSEVARAKHRMCKDTLAYVSAQVHFAFEAQGITKNSQLDNFFSSPSQDLSSLVGNEFYLPTDPWESNFILHRTAESELWVISLGGNGKMPQQPYDSSSLAKQVHLPFWAN
ncbi:MAG: hypothetical protein QGF46_01365 [Planctomycetota bacterium]|jgi:hypothetical protein|nr:hypothetical protein [Planctomycetota bacterium]